MEKFSEKLLSNLELVIFDLDGTLIDSNGVSNDIDIELVHWLGDDKSSSKQILQERDEFFKNNKSGDIYLNYGTVVTIILTLILSIGLQYFMKKTKYGKAMLATSEDYGAARLVGINVNSTIQLTFAIGSGLAAIASVLYVSAYPQVQPLMGSMLGIKAFIAAVLGGIGILPGAVIGGFILGIVESLTRAYLSSQLADAFVFAILIIVLLFKPTGLLGKNLREKV